MHVETAEYTHFGVRILIWAVHFLCETGGTRLQINMCDTENTEKWIICLFSAKKQTCASWLTYAHMYVRICACTHRKKRSHNLSAKNRFPGGPTSKLTSKSHMIRHTSAPYCCIHYWISYYLMLVTHPLRVSCDQCETKEFGRQNKQTLVVESVANFQITAYSSL